MENVVIERNGSFLQCSLYIRAQHNTSVFSVVVFGPHRDTCLLDTLPFMIRTLVHTEMLGFDKRITLTVL